MYLEVKNVKKSYGEGGSFAQVLKGIPISVNRGDMCVIQGTSGSGKSTLLNCIGGLDLMEQRSFLTVFRNFPVKPEIFWMKIMIHSSSN